MAITILELALHRGAKEEEDGSISMGAVEAVNLPFFGGCQACGASIAAYNAYPSKTGYLRCKDCIGGFSYDTASEANLAIFQEK